MILRRFLLFNLSLYCRENEDEKHKSPPNGSEKREKAAMSKCVGTPHAVPNFDSG